MADEILYAGRYKSIEELENGYKESAREATKLVEARNAAEAKLSEYTVPEDYKIPDNTTIAKPDLELNKSIAKKAGLSQKQFENMLSGIGETASTRRAAIEAENTKRSEAVAAARAKYDAKELDILEKFVTEEFPEEIAVHMKQKITEPQVYNKVKGFREKFVANKMPGMTAANPPPASQRPSFDEAKLRTAQKAAHDNPSDMGLRNDYLGMLKAKGDYEKTLTNQ